GVGVGGAAQVQVTLVDRPHGADRAGGGVGRGVVGDAVGRHAHRDVGLVDGVRHLAAGVVVVAGGVGEGPGVHRGAGVGVGGAAQVQVGLVDRADGRDRAGGGVGRGVVGDVVGRHAHRDVGLVDVVSYLAAGVVVVAGGVGEGPGVHRG